MAAAMLTLAWTSAALRIRMVGPFSLDHAPPCLFVPMLPRGARQRENPERCLTEKGQKGPRLQPGEAWPSPRAGVSPLCAKAAGAPCQRNRGGAFQLPWGTARADQWTACVLRAGCTTRRGFGPAPTPPPAAGLARLVTGRGPPEQASAWLGRWTGRLRRPRPVERLSPVAASHCGGGGPNLSASPGGASDPRSYPARIP